MFTDAENSCNDRANSIKISGKEANSKKRRELVLRSKLCHLITSILHATIARIFS